MLGDKCGLKPADDCREDQCSHCDQNQGFREAQQDIQSVSNALLACCPFCGSDNVTLSESFEGQDGLDDIWVIECQNCPAEMRGSRYDGESDFFVDEKMKIVSAWNLRAG